MASPNDTDRHRVLIVGGGFGGLYAAKALAAAPLDITLVDQANHHLFQPLLYQVATGILSDGSVAPALRTVVRGQDNVEVLLAEVTGVDLASQAATATAPDGRELTLPFDTLIGAAGVVTDYFGHDEWADYAPGLKTLDDARWLRSHILGAFEMAELAGDPAERQAWLTFALVGAGPTGVELTGQIATLAHRILPRDFHNVSTQDARVLLLDAAPSVLPRFPEKLRARAARDLTALGVEIHTGTKVMDIGPDGLTLERPDGGGECIAARTICWAAGVRAAPLAGVLAQASGAAQDRLGRLLVEPDLTLPGHPELFVVGDMAALRDLPGVAQVAMQEGDYVARVIDARLTDGAAPPPFEYRDKGTMATVGPRRAVVDAFGVQVGGLAGSVMWAFVHVMYLIGWGNRVVTVLRWLFQMTTNDRSYRLVDVEHASDWREARRHEARTRR